MNNDLFTNITTALDVYGYYNGTLLITTVLADGEWEFLLKDRAGVVYSTPVVVSDKYKPMPDEQDGHTKGGRHQSRSQIGKYYRDNIYYIGVQLPSVGYVPLTSFHHLTNATTFEWLPIEMLSDLLI